MWQNPDSFINVTDASARLGQQNRETERVSESEEGEKGIVTYSYNIHARHLDNLPAVHIPLMCWLACWFRVWSVKSRRRNYSWLREEEEPVSLIAQINQEAL